MLSTTLSIVRQRIPLLAVLVSLAAALTVLPAAPAEAAGYKLVFQDDFNGTSINKTKWGVYGGVKDGSRTAAHTIVNNGKLILRTKKVDGRWKGAGVSAARANTQLYGKYEMRVRFDAGYGIRVAGLLWPADGTWPPEIDFYEIPAASADRRINTLTNHYGTRSNHKMMHASYGGNFTQWQTVGVEWTPNAIRYTLNGRVMQTMTANIPKKKMWLGIQTRPGLGKIVPNRTTPSVVDLEVDWVKVYDYLG